MYAKNDNVHFVLAEKSACKLIVWSNMFKTIFFSKFWLCNLLSFQREHLFRQSDDEVNSICFVWRPRPRLLQLHRHWFPHFRLWCACPFVMTQCEPIYLSNHTPSSSCYEPLLNVRSSLPSWWMATCKLWLGNGMPSLADKLVLEHFLHQHDFGRLEQLSSLAWAICLLSSM